VWGLLRDDSESSSGADSVHADSKFEFHEDLQDEDEGFEDLLESTRLLSERVFKFDCIERAEERDWTVTALAEVIHGRRIFCGFLCYVLRPEPQAELNIKLLAVSSELKGRGHGTKLMEWLVSKASRMPPSNCRWLTVSAWTSAVSFYERFGFCDMGCGGDADGSDDDEEEEEQVWMELQNILVDSVEQ